MTHGLTLTTQSDGSQALMGRLAIETLRKYPKMTPQPLQHYHGNDKRMRARVKQVHEDLRASLG